MFPLRRETLQVQIAKIGHTLRKEKEKVTRMALEGTDPIRNHTGRYVSTWDLENTRGRQNEAKRTGSIPYIISAITCVYFCVLQNSYSIFCRVLNSSDLKIIRLNITIPKCQLIANHLLDVVLN